MSGELGSETYIDLLLLSLQLGLHQKPSRSKTTIFIRIWCRKVGVFEFSRISRRDRVEEKKKIEFFIYLFFCTSSAMSGLGLPNLVAQFAVVHEI